MNPEYVNVTPQQVGHKATNLGISGTPEALMEFAFWAQRMALAEKARRDLALDKMVANAESLDLYLSKEASDV